VVLGSEARTSCRLGKHCKTELSYTFFFYKINDMMDLPKKEMRRSVKGKKRENVWMLKSVRQ
jgi:hypothetical protein